jgi:hypothetical protein
MKSVKNEVFVWTEAFNCGEILSPMLSSYLKHNNFPIHVYGTQNDFDEISLKSELVVCEKLTGKDNSRSIESKILNGYKRGHRGTAILWEYLINSRSEKIFIHLDSDTIFLDNVVSDLINAVLNDGYAIAGARRAYRNRTYRVTGIDGKMLNLRPDVVHTDCFAFNKQYIKKQNRFWLRRKILGKRVSIKPVVDFFDSVTFDIIKEGGRIRYMDSPNNGFHSSVNRDSKFMQSRISFAAVGSGCNFYRNGSKGIPQGYSDYALASYSLFANQLLNKDIGVPPLKNEEVEQKLAILDKENWALRSRD